nr:nicotianamine synthase family protein [Paenibacillus sp. SYP-B3998]
MQSLAFEIKQLTGFSRECSDCFELLRMKLDDLCRFMTSEENERQWDRWEHPGEDIRLHSGQLREASTEALCELEKYQSIQMLENKMNISEYMAKLSNAIQEELQHFRIDPTSKVLFIGSGAFPLSALTIAKDTGAAVLCVDMDAEAVHLGKRVTELIGLHNRVQFSGKSVNELSFVNEATHIMIASLVRNKIEIVENLKQSMPMYTRIILRYGNGLKSVFNYPLEKDLSQDWQLTPIVRRKSIYDTLIIEQKQIW